MFRRPESGLELLLVPAAVAALPAAVVDARRGQPVIPVANLRGSSGSYDKRQVARDHEIQDCHIVLRECRRMRVRRRAAVQERPFPSFMLSSDVARQPTDYTYMSIWDGLVLVRNRTGAFQDWEMINNSGKWQGGCELMGPFVFKGEIGDEPISVEDARTVAEKLNGSVDDFEVVPEPARDDLDV